MSLTLQEYLAHAHPDWKDMDGDACCADCGAPIVKDERGKPEYDCTCRIERWLATE